MTIALDVDGVVCNWWGGILRTGKKMGLRDKLPMHENWINKWYGSGAAFNKVWDAVKNDKDWWMDLEPIKGALESINFDVECFLTARPVDPNITMLWLKKNGFERWKTVRNSGGYKKVDVMKHFGYRVLVDDKPDILEEVRACSDAPVRCYLMDQPWNRSHNDAGWRIYSLAELPEKMGMPRLGDSPPPLTGGIA